MKTMMALFILSLSISSFASSVGCYQQMSKDFSRDMAVFKLYGGELEVSRDQIDILSEVTAIAAIEAVLKKETTNCSFKDIDRSYKVKCEKLMYAKVCEVQTEIGYFLVQHSDFGHAMYALTWSRWD